MGHFLLLILIKLTNPFYGCITPQSNANDVIGCINLITSPKDIKETDVSICSQMVKEEKWYGYLCLCRINGVKGNFELARKTCLKAKEKNPFSEDVAYEIAYLYMKNNKIDEALIEANFAYSISTQNVKTNLLLAKIYEKKEIFDKAYTHYENSLKLLQKDPLNLMGKKTFIEYKLKELKNKIEKNKKTKIEKDYKKCIEEYRSIKENDKALEKLESCFKIKKENDLKLNIEYINLLYVNSRYDDFIEKAYPLLNQIKDEKEKNKIYLKIAKSYRNIHNNKKALEYYKKIANTLDINELEDYATLLEEENDKISSLEIYKNLYSKTDNKKYEEKIDELETLSKSSTDILKEMKDRGFIEKDKMILSPEDRKKFFAVKLIEKKGAVDWVKTNYSGYANIIGTLNGKDVLLLNGYTLFLRKISQEMIRILEKNKVSPHYIFKMLDENGNPIFDEKGYLTYEGIVAYYNHKETGKKTWFYKTEIDSFKKDDKKDLDQNIEETIKKLTRNGYDEITEDEYSFLQRKTTCPDDILLSYPCNIKKIKYQNKYRYFICSSLKCVEDAFYTPIKLFSYIVSYREGSLKDDDAMSNFFGKGARKKRFCENGKIWKGPEFSDESKRNEELQKELEMIQKHKEKMMKTIQSYSPKIGKTNK